LLTALGAEATSPGQRRNHLGTISPTRWPSGVTNRITRKNISDADSMRIRCSLGTISPTRSPSGVTKRGLWGHGSFAGELATSPTSRRHVEANGRCPPLLPLLNNGQGWGGQRPFVVVFAPLWSSLPPGSGMRAVPRYTASVTSGLGARCSLRRPGLAVGHLLLLPSAGLQV